MRYLEEYHMSALFSFQYLICNKWSNFAQITQSRIRTIHSLVVLSAQEPLQEFYLLLLVQIQVNGLDKLSLHTLFGHRWLPCFLDLSITQVYFYLIARHLRQCQCTMGSINKKGD